MLSHTALLALKLCDGVGIPMPINRNISVHERDTLIQYGLKGGISFSGAVPSDL